ncbi:transglycosylase SLT domain-containing protein [Nitrincola iocasae]|uniref:Transglycosylase SLT domain-containing protein n=1 Tax=Nitrincola iocasae TaxID=2614693 RepID=A0A5J6LAK2_9GAMM|nr:transglycosylase SLT domain-containing protein [Nitrincola iocasae]QEW05639.1 transglycosylase SLT domain-containing protein [Nitrincola iocasae]
MRSLAMILCLLLLLVACQPAQAQIPHSAHQYRNDLTRQARLIWGLNAPVALFAAQVHQESAWNVRAVSPVGAKGLAQFMPATAAWMPDIDRSLANPQPFNPTWSFRALARYNYWHFQRIKADTDCDRWAFTLSAYNGGLGWVLRDKARAAENGDSRWLYWDHTERYNAGRSAANFRENRDYVQRIIHRHQSHYATWGPSVCASH